MGWPPELEECEHHRSIGFCSLCYENRKRQAEKEYKRRLKDLKRKKEEKEANKIFKKRSQASRKGWETRHKQPNRKKK